MSGVLDRVQRFSRRHIARTHDELLALLIAKRLNDLQNVGRYLWAANRLGQEGLLRNYRLALAAEPNQRIQAFWAEFGKEANE